MKELDEFTEPELYDIFNNNCMEDVLWYIEFCKRHTSILELGVGTGRVAIPLAQDGHEVWGIDNSVNMLRLLRQKISLLDIKRIHIVEQNMCNIKINRKFDVAIVPFCTFNFLLSMEEQQSTLLSLRECLAYNSVVAFELMTLQTFSIQNGSSRFVYYKSFNNGLENMDIYLKNNFNPKNSILKQNRLIKIRENKRIVEKNLVMQNKIISLEEFEQMLNLCGYKVQDVFGDFKYSPYDCKSKSLIVIAQRN